MIKRSRLTVLALAVLLLITTGSVFVEAAIDYPVVKVGSRGENAAATQYLLNYRGYPVSVDGIFGEKSAVALKEFQMKNGLTPDGIAGEKTFERLTSVLRSGDRNSAVFAVQYMLKNKFGVSISVNGSFDAATLDGVKAFQSFTGIGSDGIVGQTTWRYLLGCSGFKVTVEKKASDIAIAKAKSLLGSTAYNGYCQRFVRISYEAAGIYGSAATASEAWEKWGVSSSAIGIPKGATVYFTTSSGSGHVGIYTGDGYVIHAVQTVKIETLDAMRAKYRYLGWGYQGGVNPN